MGILSPSLAGYIDGARNLGAAEFLSDGDVGVIVEGLIKAESAVVEFGVNGIEDGVAGGIDFGVDDVGFGENLDLGGFEFKYGKLGGEIKDLFPGDLSGMVERTGGKESDVGFGVAAGHKLFAQIVEEPAERIGKVGNEGEAIYALRLYKAEIEFR